MNAQETALVALAQALGELQVLYMVIGGLANMAWGVARVTIDVDVTVWVNESSRDDVVDRLATRFTCALADPRALVRETRVLPLRAANGVLLEVIFGLLPFEEEAVRRAVLLPVGGAKIRFCTAEDLILHKVISERPKDLDDVRGILRRRRGKLDVAYLSPRVHELAEIMERPEIEERYLAWSNE